MRKLTHILHFQLDRQRFLKSGHFPLNKTLNTVLESVSELTKPENRVLYILLGERDVAVVNDQTDASLKVCRYYAISHALLLPC